MITIGRLAVVSGCVHPRRIDCLSDVDTARSRATQSLFESLLSFTNASASLILERVLGRVKRYPDSSQHEEPKYTRDYPLRSGGRLGVPSHAGYQVDPTANHEYDQDPLDGAWSPAWRLTV